MKAITKILAGGAGIAMLAGAAPAAAQYYPAPTPYGYGYGQSGGLGAIIDQILGGNRYNNGVDQRALVERCIAAVNDRIARQYSGRYATPYGTPYGGQYGAPYGGQYGYGNAYGASNARVLGVTDIDRRSNSLRVRGVATANAQAAYAAPYGGGQYGAPYGSPYGAPYGNAYGYNAPQQVGELTFRCDVDYRGYVRDINLNRNRNAYGYYRR